MENDKNPDFDDEKEGEYTSEPAPRARNRTVMLTPDITGEVRARLARELSAQPAGSQFGSARGGGPEDRRGSRGFPARSGRPSGPEDG